MSLTRHIDIRFLGVFFTNHRGSTNRVRNTKASGRLYITFNDMTLQAVNYTEGMSNSGSMTQIVPNGRIMT